jgi:hypothetical protein
VGEEEADVDLPDPNPPAGTDRGRGCSVGSWTVKLVSGLVPVFLMVIVKATFPPVSFTRFTDWIVNWALPLITWVLFTKIEATKLPPIITIAIVMRTAYSWLMPRLLLERLWYLDMLDRRRRGQEFLNEKNGNPVVTTQLRMELLKDLQQ